MKNVIQILLLIACQPCLSQSSFSKFTADPVFPGKGKFNSGLITTYRGGAIAPPVVIVDLTYGVSRKVSLGIVAGTTGTLALAGLRVNTILFQKENFRGIFKFNAIYYPGRDGKFLFDKSIQHVMPWMFTMGIADLEWKTKNGTRWSLGIGYLETHCIDGMLKFFHLSNSADEDDIAPFQFYNVVHGGVSIPLSKRFFIRPELVVVMRGFEPVPNAVDSKVSPFNPYLNLVYIFGK